MIEKMIEHFMYYFLGTTGVLLGTFVAFSIFNKVVKVIKSIGNLTVKKKV